MDAGCSSKPSLRRPAVLAAVAFIAFFIWIVVIADEGQGTPWWSVIIDHLPYGDKVGHLCLIGTMSFLCNLAFPSRKLRFVTMTTLVLLIVLSLEELSQGFIKSRHLDFFDWLADLAGLAVGQFCAMKIRGCLKSPATTAP
ncbi:MAG: VanZ family protein [Luteolibacter sp.]